MKKASSLLALTSALFFSGCFGTFLAVPVTSQRDGSDMVAEEKIVKDVGDVILNAYNYSVLEGIKLQEEFSASVMLGTVSVPPRAFLAKYVDPDTETSYYCGNYFTPVTGKVKDYKFCLTEDLDDLDSFIVVYNKNKTMGPYELEDTISYRKVKRIDTSKPFQKAELIFDGTEKNMIIFTYREFANSFERPSFSSQIRYYLKKNRPTMISYKNARIKIYKADAQRITYKIIRPFDSYVQPEQTATDVDEFEVDF